jgi:integrase
MPKTQEPQSTADQYTIIRTDLFADQEALAKVLSDYHAQGLNVEEEIQKLILELPKRLSLIIETLANTGLRVSELIGIKKANINKIKSDLYNTYFDIIGKGNKHRSIFIENELLARIQTEFNGKEYLFETTQGKQFNRTYITRKLNEHSGKIINKNIHSHTLRHSFVTNEIKNGSPIDAISRQVGHSNVSFTLSKYSHNAFTAEMKKTKFKGKSL